MKKSMLILLICTAFTACGNYETETAVTENVATETATQLHTEAVTQAITEIAAPEVIEKIIPHLNPSSQQHFPKQLQPHLQHQKHS